MLNQSGYFAAVGPVILLVYLFVGGVGRHNIGSNHASLYNIYQEKRTSFVSSAYRRAVAVDMQFAIALAFSGAPQLVHCCVPNSDLLSFCFYRAADLQRTFSANQSEQIWLDETGGLRTGTPFIKKATLLDKLNLETWQIAPYIMAVHCVTIFVTPLVLIPIAVITEVLLVLRYRELQIIKSASKLSV